MLPTDSRWSLPPTLSPGTGSSSTGVARKGRETSTTRLTCSLRAGCVRRCCGTSIVLLLNCSLTLEPPERLQNGYKRWCQPLQNLSAHLERIRIDEPRKESLDLLLLSGARLRFDVLFQRPLLNLIERHLAIRHCLGVRRLPSGVAVGEHLVIPAVLDDLRRGEERSRAKIGPAYMGMDHIFRLEALPANFRVEIAPALVQTSGLDHVIHAY